MATDRTPYHPGTQGDQSPAVDLGDGRKLLLVGLRSSDAGDGDADPPLVNVTGSVAITTDVPLEVFLSAGQVPLPVDVFSQSAVLDINIAGQAAAVGVTVVSPDPLPVILPGTQDVNIVGGIADPLPVSLPADPLPVEFPADDFQPVRLAEAIYDAFGRTRVAQPATLFDSKQIHEEHSLLFWDEDITNASGNASSTHVPADACFVMHAESGDEVIRQTYQSFNYQPGKSQLIIMTGVLGAAVAGTIGRIGYFDTNNGIRIERNGTALRWVIRKNGVDSEVVEQANWSEDALDGDGPSGITLDPSKTVIYWIDFEWLGVGQVRCGVVIDGQIIYTHHFHHSNSFDSVYMSTPNLPLRYEVSSTGPTTELDHICSAVMSEGGQDPTGVTRGQVVPQRTSLGTGNLYAIMGLRLQADHTGDTVDITGIDFLSESNDNLIWKLCFRPTIAGAARTWTDVPAGGLQYGTAVNANTVSDEGYVVQAGFVKASESLSLSVESLLRLGASIGGVPDEIWLCVEALATNATLRAAMNWRQIG